MKKSSLPSVSETQLKKLKQLSIITFAADEKVLHYKTLMGKLDVSNVRELEDMIIDCIYAGLIVGKLDQKRSIFDVQNAIGRDIGPDDVKKMRAKLASWLSATGELMSSLDEQLEVSRKEHESRKGSQLSFEEMQAIEKQRAVEAVMKELEEGKGGPSGAHAFRDPRASHKARMRF